MFFLPPCCFDQSQSLIFADAHLFHADDQGLGALGQKRGTDALYFFLIYGDAALGAAAGFDDSLVLDVYKRQGLKIESLIELQTVGSHLTVIVLADGDRYRIIGDRQGEDAQV